VEHITIVPLFSHSIHRDVHNAYMPRTEKRCKLQMDRRNRTHVKVKLSKT